MASLEDPENLRRHHGGPFTSHHPVPTIQGYRQEQEARRSEAEQHGDGEHTKGIAEKFMHSDDGSPKGTESNRDDKAEKEQEGGTQQTSQSEQRNGDENVKPMTDTSEADAAAQDPRAQRKELKKRKDEQASRVVTDPVTHLPITIHDFTSQALKDAPENDDRFGSTSRTSTGVDNKKKTAKQLHEELKYLQSAHESMQALFPPPDFEVMKQELQHVYLYGVTMALVGSVFTVAVVAGVSKIVRSKILGINDVQSGLAIIAVWGVPAIITIGIVWALISGVRDWMATRIDSMWEDEIWEAGDRFKERHAKAHETETVAWLNALLGSVWPLINPDLFTSIADMLEDVMQASLPKFVQMVSVNDIGQGSESIRILGIRWLPTGAAARAVTEDGKLQDRSNGNGPSQDGKNSGQNSDKNTAKPEQAQQGEDGSQQQVAEGLEAEEGDFVNVEIAFAYRAKSNKKSLKDRARDMHMYIAFYLPGTLKVPVWVDLRGLVGTMRMRMQLCPDPPFFDLCTITFLGQPKVDISCTPLSRHALNIMDVPFISNFVQSAVDAAMAQYVAPKSLNLDLKDMISGDDFKKDTTARGVLVVHVKRGYDFKKGDTGIPMMKDSSSDPYVSVGWAKFGKPVWSTRLLVNEMEPWWDETAQVLVTDEELNVDEMLRVALWDSDRLTADDDLGRIEVGLKELMQNSKSNGRMWERSDGFRSMKAGEDMPGKLEWSVGYFSKTTIQDSQLQKQTFDPAIRTMDQLKEKVDDICKRKLREANVKEGRHKREADELEQQRKQELKGMQDAMIISAPPPDGYPSGIFSIQIHQITGLELEQVSKQQSEKDGEVDDEEEEGEGLPSAYCTVLINHSKVFKTRTKPKNAKPFYNASTERYIADWRNTEVFVAVRDSRVKEDDPLLGIVYLPLGEVFKERCQVNGFYPLAGGVGYGRIRLSMVWRSVQLQAPREALGWNYGTLEIQPEVPPAELPKELRGQKIRFHTDLGSGKMYPGKDDQGWHSKNKQSLMLPVRKRYSICLAVEFVHHGMFSESTDAFAVFWLKNIPDEEEHNIEVPVWKGNFERATKNVLPEPGEKIGSMKLKLKFWEGLGGAHSKWASKDANVREVMEVLDTARDNLDKEKAGNNPGISDSSTNYQDGASDSSDDDERKAQTNGDKSSNGDIADKAKNLKKHHDDLSKRNRGMMQWKIPRTAQWAKHKMENLEAKVEDMFEHESRQPDVETEV